MAKRRAVVDSDDEDFSGTSPASKRARANDGSPAAPEAPVNKKKGKKAAAKEKGNSSKADANDAEQDEAERMAIDDEEFEKRHMASVREQIENKTRKEGGIAEFGIIESVEMHQFMCHKYLTFSFGPQVNFIIGHNGSGKSAVLSAITVALGGKSASTGRGSGLKSFIREGQAAAQVTVQLKNKGEDAYKPREYGDSIVIQRKFTKEGNTIWKIMSKAGKVISSKKEEVSAICDHMNIQVDNPMNVLTQDAARQFLSASSQGEKYDLFMRGTQLQQLSEEYQTCLQNISQTNNIIGQKKEALPDLEQAFNSAKADFEEATKARRLKEEIEELKKEMAWSHVQDKEDELTQKIADVAKLERLAARITKEIEKAKNAEAEATAVVTVCETDVQALGDIKALRETRERLKAEMKEGRTELHDLKQSVEQIQHAMKTTRFTIENFERRIADENARAAHNSLAKRQERESKLEEVKEAILRLEAEHGAAVQAEREASSAVDELRSAGEASMATKDTLQKQVLNLETQINRCKLQKKNTLAVYGNNMDVVLKEINGKRWRGEMPIGPLGQYVKLRDMRYADIIRINLGGVMSSFAVTDAQDRRQLKEILEKHKNYNTSIFISSSELFDYSSGEPPEGFMTILRALEVDDEWVKRILINNGQIEKNILALTRKDAQDTLDRLPRGGHAFTAQDFFRVTKYAEGGGASAPLNRLKPNDSRNGLFMNKDIDSTIRELEEKKTKTEEELQKETVAERTLRSDFNGATQTLQSCKKRTEQAFNQLRNARDRRAALVEETNQAMPSNIAALEEAKREAEEEKESYIVQFRENQEQKAAVDERQTALQDQYDELKEQIDAFDQRKKDALAKVEKAATERAKAQKSIEYHKDKLTKEEEKIKVMQKQQQQLQIDFEDWTKSAQVIAGEPWQKPRSVKALEIKIAASEKALKNREDSDGKTVEEVTIAVNRTNAALKTARGDLEHMSALVKALQNSISARLTKWFRFRQHISLRTKAVFQFMLSRRGYYGKVLFDHSKGHLHLKVQTDDQAGTQAAEKDRDPRSLSGGEKSFSTICFLLALWDSIGCPLRCLDEFDVFMDAVNRRIAMKMMIDTANSSDRKQYILITPQDMTNVHLGPSVRVNRMSDPERNQGTLSFS